MSNEDRNLAKEKLAELDSKLDSLLESYGIPPKTTSNIDEVSRILNLSHLELAKMTPEQCSEASFVIRQFSFHLIKEYNREKSRQDWANSQIDKIVCGEIDQQEKFLKYEHKRNICINNNSYAFKLNSISLYAGVRAKRIEGLADKASDMARALNDISMTRRRNY